MRVVSLIASSTEMVYALGMGHTLVGRSHECDFPAAVRALPVLTAPKLRVELDPISGREPTSAEIDAQLKALLREALAVYRVDVDALEAVRPDVIITQTQCEVCAVSRRDVEDALARMVSSRPRIVALDPSSLESIFRDLRAVAEALGVAERGASLESALRGRIAALAERAREQLGARPRPTVAVIEWIEPLMAGGNWMPTLVELAGGRSLFGEENRHSPFMSFAQLAERDPDVIVVVPCGFDLARTARELPALTANPGWAALSAVRAGRVYLADGNQFFNRPGPRIVESLEILVEILQGPSGAPNGTIDLGHRGSGYVLAPMLPAPASDNVPALGRLAGPDSKESAMAQDSIRVSAVLPAEATDIYDAWLDARRHGQFTGGAATVEPRIGGRHTAWDGYIEGTILELLPGERIVQSWRSLDFPQGAPDSRLEILLTDAPGGTELTLVHTEIPEGQGVDYEEGWKEHYFKPMQRYFAASPAPAAQPKPVAKQAAPKKAAKKKPAKKAVKAAAKGGAKKAAKKAPKKAAKKVAAKKGGAKKGGAKKAASKKAASKNAAK
jgi:iron complex transport system substrate-binding protein